MTHARLHLMAKASSPVRLQSELMESAARAGALHHRSAAEQIEYWADLGRRVARVLDPDTLLDLAAGAVRLHLEPVVTPSVSPEQVFAAVDADRASGILVGAVTTAPLRYQVATGSPGYLEQIAADGTRMLGSFQDGVFTPLNTPDTKA
ncbi:hypothetical protein CyaNS01_02117 [Cyanobium sp. NS01]|nr:hypothetical protein CyaNS01_02117 [Cyanobium sp. NS01]